MCWAGAKERERERQRERERGGGGREWGRRGRYYYLSGSDVRKNL